MSGPLKVALLGIGNVGRAFCRYLLREAGPDPAVHIIGVADSSGWMPTDGPQLEKLLSAKEKGIRLRQSAPDVARADLSEFISWCARDGVSVLIESLPTNLKDGQPALGLILSALRLGVNVVTVDKGPLVHGYRALCDAALKSGTRLGNSGATGVPAPEAVRGCRVVEIRGILNGTTNHILTEMQEHGIPFKDALAEAQRAGIAEPDPSLDLDGWDTAFKMLIHAMELMDPEASLSAVSRIGIGEETGSLIRTALRTKRRVRLLGRARKWKGQVRISVAPKLVGPDSPFYSVDGRSKAAVFRTREKGEVLAEARSGRDAISQAIFEDIFRIAHPGGS